MTQVDRNPARCGSHSETILILNQFLVGFHVNTIILQIILKISVISVDNWILPKRIPLRLIPVRRILLRLMSMILVRRIVLKPVLEQGSIQPRPPVGHWVLPLTSFYNKPSSSLAYCSSSLTLVCLPCLAIFGQKGKFCHPFALDGRMVMAQTASIQLGICLCLWIMHVGIFMCLTTKTWRQRLRNSKQGFG